MPLIEIHLLEGRSDEQKKRLLAAVTDAVERSIGARRDTIRVWLRDMKATEYMAAGLLASERESR